MAQKRGIFDIVFQRYRRFIQSLSRPKQKVAIPFQIEDAPESYPRFSVLIGAHSSFCMCRRFSTVRARPLKQDHISILEAQLEQVDREETKLLFLGNARRDHIKSLQTWIESTACLARKETEFLDRKQDLMAVARPVDGVLARVQVIPFRIARPICSALRSSHFNTSRDPNVFIPSGPLAIRGSRSVLASFATVVLIIPVIVINLLSSSGVRLGIAVAASALFIFILSFLMNAQTKELFLAGATYAAVLVVFIAGNNNGT
ncbi:uncharacterized protein PAC_13716 [Phialocephala subalpina]|uniref:DUF6594 domain-containing protein n=1 Tax=Phialocephala subalpina TaxID=576137 RepID=A0A1L7XFJ5_9HELO|nr:uncharacterized protein PAC_13716 [Phialocephala subalpina]